MSTTSTKRSSNHLSPPILSETQKRYIWSSQSLLKNNPYYPLSSQDTDQDTANNTESSQASSSQPKKFKIPPIFLHNANNHQAIIADIKKIIKNDFTTVYHTHNLKINLTTEDDYRALTKYYTDQKVQFHTFQNPNSRPLNVVIRNVPVSLSDEEILNELKSKNLPIVKLTRLINREKEPIPLCAVELTANDNASGIYNVKSICQAIVTVEPRRKPRGIPQCHRCQKVGHTKNYCSLAPKCVKCGQTHLTSDCNKAAGAPPSCANCGENHPASYRGCSYIKTNEQNRQIRTRNLEQNKPQTVLHPSHNMKQSQRPNIGANSQFRTYASATQNRHNPQANNSSGSFTTIVEQLIQHLIHALTPLLENIKTFIINQLLPNLFNGP